MRASNFQKDLVVDIKNFGHNVSGALTTLKRGLIVASAAQIWRHDPQAIKRALSEK